MILKVNFGKIIGHLELPPPPFPPAASAANFFFKRGLNQKIFSSTSNFDTKKWTLDLHFCPNF